ncbi:predicted protein [Chaetoceros tenuissimus]|uniref:Uncharacterized protein n=1 Tax=Chaetoceros tenuissimus TaxID=426638 RepID=A0AAD3D0W4_9STRA|nr:predicted protein [Chaetoceros tenuissimus]
MRLRIRNQQITTTDTIMADAFMIEMLSPIGSRNMIERIKKVLRFKNQKNKNRLNEVQTMLRQLILNVQTIDGSIYSSSTLTFIDWILRGLGPEFQQKQKTHFQEKNPERVINPERVVNVADIILAIPASEMNAAIQAVDSFGSNILHLACYHGMDVHTLNYILDNCSLDSMVGAVSVQDKAGNLPLFNAVESILRGKIELREGQEVVKRLYLTNPKTIFHFNKDNYIVSEFVYDHIRHMHRESEEYQQLQVLHKYLRELIKQAYLRQKKEWEEKTYQRRPAMKLGLVDASTQESTQESAQDLAEFQNLTISNFDRILA